MVFVDRVVTLKTSIAKSFGSVSAPAQISGQETPSNEEVEVKEDKKRSRKNKED